MEKIIVNKCPACETINRLFTELINVGFTKKEERVEDYHFHQLYFKMVGDLKAIETIDIIGFTRIENKFICDCHWSTIELKVD